VLHQSGLEARSVAAFLHENVLEFVAHDGIDSAADILEYLSDAGMRTVAPQTSKSAFRARRPCGLAAVCFLLIPCFPSSKLLKVTHSHYTDG
jgi:hypothetical protein